MTRRVRYRVNISAQVMSAICDTKILTSSLVRCVAAIASAFFSTSATFARRYVSKRRIPFSTCQRHGDTRRRSCQRVSKWRRMTGTHAYSFIGQGSFVAFLTSAFIHRFYLELIKTNSARSLNERHVQRIEES